jgi:tetratricopeptide (TPR) repeat protein
VKFERAKEIFRARAEQNSDDAEQNFAAGRFYLLTEDPGRAIRAFQTSLKIDPSIPAEYFLAAAFAAKGQFDEARKILRAIGPRDPQYAKAQKMLQSLKQ